jgi:cell division protein FtsI/penicillin-binding protein 2
METTIQSGTGRKAFRRRRNSVLAKLDIGGKTGSIFNRSHDARFDWYVGYAAEKKGSQKLVVSVMVAHEEYIGIRAGQYARMTIEHFYKDYFNRQAQSAADTSG